MQIKSIKNNQPENETEERKEKEGKKEGRKEEGRNESQSVLEMMTDGRGADGISLRSQVDNAGRRQAKR